MAEFVKVMELGAEVSFKEDIICLNSDVDHNTFTRALQNLKSLKGLRVGNLLQLFVDLKLQIITRRDYPAVRRAMDEDGIYDCFLRFEGIQEFVGKALLGMIEVDVKLQTLDIVSSPK